jgi:hypothetical protein
VSFVAITLCVASQRVSFVVVVVYFVMTQSGNFWIHSRTIQNVCPFDSHVLILMGKRGHDEHFGCIQHEAEHITEASRSSA